MQPLRFPADPHPGLVEMAHRGLSHQGRDMRLDWRQFRCLLRAPTHDAGWTQGAGAKQIAHNFADPVFGNQMLDVEIQHRRADPVAILDMRGDRGRERRPRRAAAARAGVDVPLMLDHLQPRRHQIEHLTLLNAADHRISERGWTMRPRRRGMVFNLVRLGHWPQRLATMSNLATAPLARPPAKAPLDPRLLAQTIARRRLATRRTVQTKTAA